MFNLREGVNPLDFKLNERMAGVPPLLEGPLKGKSVPIEEMMRLYFKHIGWDEDSGAPLQESIAALGLETDAEGVA